MFRMTELRSRDRQAGFTLIELSIVLVLVGLLIGGILKGQELINSTRVKTQVAQVDGLRAALNSFQDKYQGLPGDITNAATILNPNATNATGGGAGDGRIGAAGGTTLNANVPTNDESALAMQHLYYAGMVSGAQLGTGTNPTTLAAKMSGSGVALRWFTFQNGTNPTDQANGVRISGGTGYGNTASIRPDEAAEMDRKYDDGSPILGTIQAAGTNCATAANEYNIVRDEPLCFIGYQMF